MQRLQDLVEGWYSQVKEVKAVFRPTTKRSLDKSELDYVTVGSRDSLRDNATMYQRAETHFKSAILLALAPKEEKESNSCSRQATA